MLEDIYKVAGVATFRLVRMRFQIAHICILLLVMEVTDGFPYAILTSDA